jgi:hypothetical protein
MNITYIHLRANGPNIYIEEEYKKIPKNTIIKKLIHLISDMTKENNKMWQVSGVTPSFD